MSVLRIRGVALPDGEVVDLYADGDRWTTEPVANAELAGEGWLVPGLVDAHTHPGAEEPGDPFDEDLLREDLHRHVAAGVTLIRSPGLAGDAPPWYGVDHDVPRAVNAGPWISQHRQFFESWGRKAALEEMPSLAAQQARRTGWVKFIVDWMPEDPVIPLDTMCAIVAAVHAEGAKIAAHSQNVEGSRIAVAAGVDSLEHGVHLDPDLLPQMASRGIVLAPTLATFLSGLEEIRAMEMTERRRWYVEGALAHPDLTAAAHEAGVTLLAGTDSHPTGTIADEILAIWRAGVPAHHALGAGSWVARRYLGLEGLVEGAPADAVVYDRDPRVDLEELRRPRAIVLRGAVRFLRD
jgi:imidazolonepropionase-like amidohydrolase